MYPFPLFLPLSASYKGKFFLFSFHCLIHSHNLIQKFSGITASSPLWRVHRYSWLCLRPNVLKAPACLLAVPRLITGSSCKYVLMCGSGNPLTPVLFLPLSGRLFLRWQEVQEGKRKKQKS